MTARRGGKHDVRNGLRLAGLAGLGLAGLAVAFPTAASAAEPVPTLYWTVDPPTLGQSHSPNPVDGTTGVSTQIALELATNNDLANNPAPTGTVTFSDSLGIITGNCNNAPAQPQNLDASYAYCTVTFPSGTAGDDIVTATYSGGSNNGATTGTQTISFGPGNGTPEVPVAAALPIIAVAIGGGALSIKRRRMARGTGIAA
jgi:hypothetical protein